MTKEIWTAASNLADKWRSSQTVNRVVSVMPRDGVPSRDPLTKMFAEYRAGSMRAHALRLHSELSYLMGQPMLGQVKRPDSFDAWFLAASGVEAAFRLQLAWLRAQLPGYPCSEFLNSLRTPRSQHASTPGKRSGPAKTWPVASSSHPRPPSSLGLNVSTRATNSRSWLPRFARQSPGNGSLRPAPH